VKRVVLRFLCVLPLMVTLVACGSSPNAPTRPASQLTLTRIVRVFGSMAFGDVALGQNVTNKLTIANDGTAPLKYTGITVSGGVASVLAASPQSGQIPPGGLLDVVVRFTPAAAQSYAGTFAIESDATSGTGTIAFSGRGTLDGIPIFRRSGNGNQVFDIPTHVTRIRIQGTWNRTSTSNFIVHIAGRSVINEILRDAITYDGTHLIAAGGVCEIVSSAQIAWTFTEVR